jgi:Galactosyltransferase
MTNLYLSSAFIKVLMQVSYSKPTTICSLISLSFCLLLRRSMQTSGLFMGKLKALMLSIVTYVLFFVVNNFKQTPGKKMEGKIIVIERTLHPNIYFLFLFQPIRNKKSKYYVSVEQFKPMTFPQFTTGPAYLITRDCVKDLYNKALNLTYLKLEDVYLVSFFHYYIEYSEF